MKHLILSIILNLIFVVAYSQNKVVTNIPESTTLEEFNYLTKGYKIQIESGLDMKKGYRLEDIHVDDSIKNNISYEFKNLYRNKDIKPCATLIIVHSYAIKDKTYYLCLPNIRSTPEIWNKYFSSFKELDSKDQLLLSFYISILYSVALDTAK